MYLILEDLVCEEADVMLWKNHSCKYPACLWCSSLDEMLYLHILTWNLKICLTF